MISPDLNQTYRYIELLRGDRDAELCWQVFNDSDNDSGYPVVFNSTLANALPTIQQYQQQGYGVYVTVNPTDGKGRKLENIVSYDYVFADIDGGSQVMQELPLKPLFITGRDATHGHYYWPVEGLTSEKQYNYVHKLVALYFGSDEQVIDPCRVARVPGLLHLKNPNDPKVYQVYQDNSDVIDFNYSFEDFKAAFTLPEEKQRTLDKFIANRESLSNGSGLNDNPIYRDAMIHWARDNAPISIKGNGRSQNLYRVALYGYDRGIPCQEVIDILWQHFNPRCEPPWTEKEYPNFVQYIENAYKYCKNAPGCRTATGIEWGVVVEPVGGWEGQRTIEIENAKTGTYDKDVPEMQYEESEGDIAFITPDQAANNRAFITNKSTVYEWALKFIGELYPYKTLIRSDKMFYVYNGIHWQETTDEAIRAQIYFHFACWKFPPSKMNNVFETVVNLTFEDKLTRMMFLDNSKMDGSKCIIMKNGIVNIEDDHISLIPHTRNFFELTALPYDYDPTATCDEFLKVIDSQWPNNQMMMMQIQEMYGLCLATNNKHQKLPIMIGKSGSGKGLHRAVITAMIGEMNVVSPSLEGLIEDHTVEALNKAKLAIIPEANNLHHFIKDKVLDRVKAITGGDSVYHDRKYKGGAQVSVWPLLLFQCNEFPDFADPSGALARRAWPIKFTRTFVGNEDRGLEQRLCAPESISGIFNWALQGLARVHANDNHVTVARESNEVVDNIRYDSFALSSFIEDFCILDPDAEVFVETLFDMYLIHARGKGIKTPYLQQKFSKLLDSSHLSVIKVRESSPSDGIKRRYLFTGIKLSDIAVQKHKSQSFTPVPQPPTNINKNTTAP